MIPFPIAAGTRSILVTPVVDNVLQESQTSKKLRLDITLPAPVSPQQLQPVIEYSLNGGADWTTEALTDFLVATGESQTHRLISATQDYVEGIVARCYYIDSYLDLSSPTSNEYTGVYDLFDNETMTLPTIEFIQSGVIYNYESSPGVFVDRYYYDYNIVGTYPVGTFPSPYMARRHKSGANVLSAIVQVDYSAWLAPGGYEDILDVPVGGYVEYHYVAIVVVT